MIRSLQQEKKKADATEDQGEAIRVPHFCSTSDGIGNEAGDYDASQCISKPFRIDNSTRPDPSLQDRQRNAEYDRNESKNSGAPGLNITRRTTIHLWPLCCCTGGMYVQDSLESRISGSRCSHSALLTRAD